MKTTPEKYIKEVTGTDIKSDAVHLYNFGGKDLKRWLQEYAELKLKEYICPRCCTIGDELMDWIKSEQ